MFFTGPGGVRHAPLFPQAHASLHSLDVAARLASERRQNKHTTTERMRATAAAPPTATAPSSARPSHRPSAAVRTLPRLARRVPVRQDRTRTTPAAALRPLESTPVLHDGPALRPTLPAATAFAPATVANLGPGFDWLGCAVDGAGDTVTAVPLPGRPGTVEIESIEGDGGRLPLDGATNCCGVAAAHTLRLLGTPDAGVRLRIVKVGV